MPTRALLPILLLTATLLGGCAAMAPPAFILGSSTQGEVIAQRGAPAMHWEEPQGVTRMVWPTGPYGTSTLIARFDAQQRLLSYEEVLNEEHFAAIQPGMSQDEVLRLIGPSYAPWTNYYAARDELALEWRYCANGSIASRFNVLFDATTRRVRSVFSQPESFFQPPPCGHTYLRVGPVSATPK